MASESMDAKQVLRESREALAALNKMTTKLEIYIKVLQRRVDSKRNGEDVSSE